MRISFLLHNGFAIGGTTRTTLNLAGELAKIHDVEIISVFRHRDSSRLEVPKGVRIQGLVDEREGSPDRENPSFGVRGAVFPRTDSRSHQYHRLAEERIISWLAETRSDIIVGTRAGLNVMLARFGPSRAVRVAQEHLTHDGHPHGLRAEIQKWYPSLDCLVTMTHADAERHRRCLSLDGVRILSIPNSIPEPVVPPSDGNGKVIVAAGRLTKVKRYEMLIDAFAPVSAKHPDWVLRIYGGGAERDNLRKHIDQLGLHNQVLLMGAATPIEAEWVKGSIAAVTSSSESFGMTIIEAMRCGLPVVSTDCPHGPSEIIENGVDGLLVPRDNAHAVSGALSELIEDEDRRTRMGQAAHAAAQRFDVVPIAARYDQLFSELAAARGESSPRQPKKGKLPAGVIVLRGTLDILTRAAYRRVFQKYRGKYAAKF